MFAKGVCPQETGLLCRNSPQRDEIAPLTDGEMLCTACQSCLRPHNTHVAGENELGLCLPPSPTTEATAFLTRAVRVRQWREESAKRPLGALPARQPEGNPTSWDMSPFKTGIHHY